jgi:hypothetical protein
MTKNVKKIATPPKRGIGNEWTWRAELGANANPIRLAQSRTSFVNPAAKTVEMMSNTK